MLTKSPYYSHVTWAIWRLKSPPTACPIINKENIKVPHCWPFVRGNPLVTGVFFPHKSQGLSVKWVIDISFVHWLVYSALLVFRGHISESTHSTGKLWGVSCAFHYDGIKLNHFPRYWPFVRGTTGHRWIPKGQWGGALMFSFIWSVSEQTLEQTIEAPVIWDAIALIITSL